MAELCKARLATRRWHNFRKSQHTRLRLLRRDECMTWQPLRHTSSGRPGRTRVRHDVRQSGRPSDVRSAVRTASSRERGNTTLWRRLRADHSTSHMSATRRTCVPRGDDGRGRGGHYVWPVRLAALEGAHAVRKGVFGEALRGDVRLAGYCFFTISL